MFLSRKNYSKCDICISGTQLVFLNIEAIKKCLEFINPYNLPLDVFYATLVNLNEIDSFKCSFTLTNQKKTY